MTPYFIVSLLTITSIANAAEQEVSCREELGKEAASVYVQQCIEISPATHPPCNDLNSCTLIKDEIKRGCDYVRETENAEIPSFCD